MKTQFGKVILESDICVLCGKRPAITKEHIPPQSLYHKNKPKEYLKVPACEECNGSTKLDDEYLEQVMSGASLVGQGTKIWKEKVSPKLKDRPKTKAGLRENLALASIETEMFKTMILPAMKVNPQRIRTNIKKMVYGLHWFETNGRLLSPNAYLDIRFLNVIDFPRATKNPKFYSLLNQLRMGIYEKPEERETFFYTGLITEKMSVWCFFFYKQNAVIVFQYRNRLRYLLTKFVNQVSSWISHMKSK